MSGLFGKIRKINHRHYICVGVTLAFVCLGVFIYTTSLERLVESFKDLGTSFVRYFAFLFSIALPDNVVTVTQPSGVTFPVENNFEQFQFDFKTYWALFADKAVFISYLKKLSGVLFYAIVFIELILALSFGLKLVLSQCFYKTNNKYNIDTKPLMFYKRLRGAVIIPIRDYIRSYKEFLSVNRIYRGLWLTIWLINLNILSIVVSFFAYVLYFSVSFGIGELPFQLYKLYLDLTLMFNGLPWYVWVVIFTVIFDLWRKARADKRLRGFEHIDEGFLMENPICLMVNGDMGKGKTTLAVDMMLSQRIIFRDKSKEILDNCAAMFPNFPWINLELELQYFINYGYIFNLAGIEKYIVRKCRIYDEILEYGAVYKCVKRNADRLIFIDFNAPYWGYNIDLYGMTYNNRLSIVPLQSVIRQYAEAYFIYTCQNYSLSNISVRFDDIMYSEGNLPLWDTDFFSRDPEESERWSRYSKILDQDMLRLGKLIKKDNPHAGSLEFGIILMSEIGKERLNQVEQQGIKKNSEETNQRNDLFNYYIKMCRHPSTISYFPFFRFFADEQRAQSLGADLRELCALVDIDSKGENRIAIPFFTLEDMICDWIVKKYNAIYTKYRFYRGDNTLSMHLIKAIGTAFKSYQLRRYNRYGFNRIVLNVEQGTMDGKVKSYVYYLMPKKIYSDRFSTDCYSGYFRERALRTGVGMNDYPEYGSTMATAEELRAQNSYFIRTIEENVRGDKE